MIWRSEEKMVRPNKRYLEVIAPVHKVPLCIITPMDFCRGGKRKETDLTVIAWLRPFQKWTKSSLKGRRFSGKQQRPFSPMSSYSTMAKPLPAAPSAFIRPTAPLLDLSVWLTLKILKGSWAVPSPQSSLSSSSFSSSQTAVDKTLGLGKKPSLGAASWVLLGSTAGHPVRRSRWTETEKRLSSEHTHTHPTEFLSTNPSENPRKKKGGGQNYQAGQAKAYHFGEESLQVNPGMMR